MFSWRKPRFSYYYAMRDSCSQCVELQEDRCELHPEGVSNAQTGMDLPMVELLGTIPYNTRFDKCSPPPLRFSRRRAHLTVSKMTNKLYEQQLLLSDKSILPRPNRMKCSSSVTPRLEFQTLGRTSPQHQHSCLHQK